MKQSANGQSAAKLEWRIIEECPCYAVSNTGLVKNLRTNQVLKLNRRARYYTAALQMGGVRKNRYVHRLVAVAFVPNPDNLPYVNHINFN